MLQGGFATNPYGKLASFSGWFVIEEAGAPESFLSPPSQHKAFPLPRNAARSSSESCYVLNQKLETEIQSLSMPCLLLWDVYIILNQQRFGRFQQETL